MKDIITEYIKSLQLKVVLRYKIIKGELSLYQCDAIDYNDKYHSILVAYNSTRIFSISSNNLIGEKLDNAALGCLEKNHRVFDNREDWLNGRFPAVTEQTLKRFCKGLCIENNPLVYNKFSLDRIMITLNPIFSYVVFYKFNKVEQQPLILVDGQLTDCSKLWDKESDFYYFIELVGLKHLIS